MLATDISATACLTNWVNNVSSSGTFVKNHIMTTLPTGINGIPTGWTVGNELSDYFKIKALGAGNVTITIPAEISGDSMTSISYSKDGLNWTDTTIDDTAQTITVPVVNGDTVYLKGVGKRTAIDYYTTYTNITSTVNYNVCGNIMSLLYGEQFGSKTSFPTTSAYSLDGLFRNSTTLVNACDLILPATTLPGFCYSYLFCGCSSLISTPKLPATNFGGYCYALMFYGCTSLSTPPVLSSTTLSTGCYQYMFYGCTSLETAPELPAATMQQDCYYRMFRGCTSLVKAPELKALTLASNCYCDIFYGCTSLNYIKMMATDVSASSCLTNWVTNVSATGTFVKNAAMTTLPTGANGIPSGWTVQDAT